MCGLIRRCLSQTVIKDLLAQPGLVLSKQAMTVAVKEPEVVQAAPSRDYAAAAGQVTTAAQQTPADTPSSHNTGNANKKLKQAKSKRRYTTLYVVISVVVVIIALAVGGQRAAQVRSGVCLYQY